MEWPVVIALIAAGGASTAPGFAWLSQRRNASGRIEHTPVAQLWDESTQMRHDQQEDNAELRVELKAQREDNAALRVEISELRVEIKELRGELAAVRKERGS